VASRGLARTAPLADAPRTAKPSSAVEALAASIRFRATLRSPVIRAAHTTPSSSSSSDATSSAAASVTLS